VLAGLLESARAGQSGVLVLRGQAGIGKTALLEYVIGSASDMRVARAVGVHSEMELAFAALHQLCGPVLDRLDGLPGPQRDAPATTFGLRACAVPDRFFVGLAVLGLLSDAAEVRPLLCVIDDAVVGQTTQRGRLRSPGDICASPARCGPPQEHRRPPMCAIRTPARRPNRQGRSLPLRTRRESDQA
jgi:hypothetical protein